MVEAGPTPTGNLHRRAVRGHLYLGQRSLLRGHLSWVNSAHWQSWPAVP